MVDPMPWCPAAIRKVLEDAGIKFIIAAREAVQGCG
jgi:hypothetical protein